MPMHLYASVVTAIKFFFIIQYCSALINTMHFQDAGSCCRMIK